MKQEIARVLSFKEFFGIPNPVLPLVRLAASVRDIQRRLDLIQVALGRIETRLDADAPTDVFHDHEFQVFSQWGEDGLIQYLLRRVAITSRVFVEFGVQDYQEANTRFLVEKDNWKGFVIDCVEASIEAIRRDSLSWRSNVKSICAFVNTDNINDIIRSQGIEGEIGLLSIDIDGNDYWVWQAIDCIRPGIVICEYNGLFGPSKKLVTPYDAKFDRTRAHFTYCYFGASLAALTFLGRQKGYALVGSNSAGNNAFFVRGDLLGEIAAVEPEQAYRLPRFREARDESGRLSYGEFRQTQDIIGDMLVFDLDLDLGRQVRLRDAVAT